MHTFRLTIHRQDKLLGHFESDAPWAADAVRELATTLTDAGYDLALLVADSERQLLESSPEGIRVLSREPIFKAVPLASHLPAKA
ncbi:cytoplasmic protein [Pseudomonas sp.]|uniref:cytoplasmic protein n=1 Tax=Pseudomonas sp. TaxID=306 RepID=UPI003D0D1EBB